MSEESKLIFLLFLQKLLVEKLSDVLPGSYEALEPVLTRAAPVILNKTIIPSLIGMLEPNRSRRRATQNPKALVAQELLKVNIFEFLHFQENYNNLMDSIWHVQEIATSFPIMYEDHVYELIRGITDVNTTIGMYLKLIDIQTNIYRHDS